MANLIVPNNRAESLRSENTFVWAEGAYGGVIEKTEVRDLPATQTGQPFAGYSTTSGERLSIQIGDVAPLEGQPEVGARKWFVDIVLKDGDKSIEDYPDLPDSSWQLRRSAELLANLANVLQAVTYLEDGNVAVNEGFVDALKSGQYDKSPLGFVVYHTKRKDKQGNPYQEIETFIIP